MHINYSLHKHIHFYKSLMKIPTIYDLDFRTCGFWI